ncbi:hypothetical protein ACVPOW_13185 [Staphylococcus aureus]
MGNASIFISNGKNPKQALDEATNDITQNMLRFFIHHKMIRRGIDYNKTTLN